MSSTEETCVFRGVAVEDRAECNSAVKATGTTSMVGVCVQEVDVRELISHGPSSSLQGDGRASKGSY